MNTFQVPTRYMMRSAAVELSREELSARVPSAFAEKAHEDTTSRYSFFPTATVIEALRDSGWAPVSVQEQTAREEGRKGFQKHLVRFHRRSEINTTPLGDSRIELVMMNSHDGGCAFRLYAGVFRQVCSNGLVVSDATYGAVSIRHTHRTIEEVITTSQKIAGDSGRIGDSIESFRQRTLTDEEKLNFASRALTLRYDSVEESPVYPAKLLEPVRLADQGNSLWQTFNVVQERMMRGSRPDRLKALREGRRLGRVRKITGLDSQLAMNRDLWELAASYLN